MAAIASDYASAPGANPTITVFDELWAYTSERMISDVLDGGICHTLASYVSMQAFPTFTESGGHLSVPAVAGTATASVSETTIEQAIRLIRFSLVLREATHKQSDLQWRLP